jgi:site-specific DNA recombinase
VLHIGLKRTMNTHCSTDLALKTYLGLCGKIEAGKSGGGNAYGYRAVRGFVADGSGIAGHREFHPNEAAIVGIFQEFALTNPRARSP